MVNGRDVHARVAGGSKLAIAHPRMSDSDEPHRDGRVSARRYDHVTILGVGSPPGGEQRSTDLNVKAAVGPGRRAAAGRYDADRDGIRRGRAVVVCHSQRDGVTTHGQIHRGAYSGGQRGGALSPDVANDAAVRIITARTAERDRLTA